MSEAPQQATLYRHITKESSGLIRFGGPLECCFLRFVLFRFVSSLCFLLTPIVAHLRYSHTCMSFMSARLVFLRTHGKCLVNRLLLTYTRDSQTGFWDSNWFGSQYFWILSASVSTCSSSLNTSHVWSRVGGLILAVIWGCWIKAPPAYIILHFTSIKAASLDDLVRAC